jgi:hypothetical protein
VRSQGIPIEITQGGIAEGLGRLDLSQRHFSESWLQQIVHENPSLLPVDHLRPSLGPLASLGREIGTAAGPIDNLFVDPNGTLVIIETKLWRNPQARREVVGQIVDYAAALGRMNFEQLDDAVRVGNHGRGIVELTGNDADSADRLIDGIGRALHTGDLLLLVVGDGIRESLEGIAEFLAGAPHLGFTFGLIEIGVYESTNGTKLVVPSLVAHSVEITRATVRVEAPTDGRIDVRVEAMPGDEGDSSTRRKKLDAATFAATLQQAVDPGTYDQVLEWRSLVEQDPRMRVDYGIASMIFRLKPTGFAREFTGLVVSADGVASVGWLYDQAESVGAPPEIAKRFAHDTAALVGAAAPARYDDTWGDGTGGSSGVDIGQVLMHRDAFTARMRQVADELEDALNS